MRRRRGQKQYWTLERVVAQIQQLHRAGGLAPGAAATRKHGALVAAAQRTAGSWTKALRLAGVDYSPRRTWTRGTVLDEIRHRHARGDSLAQTAVPTALALAARRRFGSWRAARRAALPTFEELLRTWTRPDVVAQLRDLQRTGVRLEAPYLRRVSHGPLVSAAIRLFGSWSGAVMAALPQHVWKKRPWSAARVAAALRARHDAGRAVASHLVQREDASLVNAARRYHGNWPRACAAAGVPLPTKEVWSASAILSMIAGELSRDPWPRTAAFPKAMANKATVVFGSWRAALAAAGADPLAEASGGGRRGQRR